MLIVIFAIFVSNCFSVSYDLMSNNNDFMLTNDGYNDSQLNYKCDNKILVMNLTAFQTFTLNCQNLQLNFISMNNSLLSLTNTISNFPAGGCAFGHSKYNIFYYFDADLSNLLFFTPFNNVTVQFNDANQNYKLVSTQFNVAYAWNLGTKCAINGMIFDYFNYDPCNFGNNVNAWLINRQL